MDKPNPIIDILETHEPVKKIPTTQIGFATLRQNGWTVKEASKAVNFHYKYGYAIDKKLEKLHLKSPKMQKLAYKAVKETLEMKPIEQEVFDSKSGEVQIVKVKPTHTNRLQAAGMVVDRTEPAVKVNQNLNLNADISPVDLSKYMKG